MIEKYYRDTQANVVGGMIKLKSINKVCEEREIATGGKNMRRRFTTLWRKSGLEKSWKEGVPFERANSKLLDLIEKRRRKRKDVIVTNARLSIGGNRYPV